MLVDALADAGWGPLREAPQSVRTLVRTLAREADKARKDHGGVIMTTNPQLAEKCGLSKATIDRAWKWLRETTPELVAQIVRGFKTATEAVASRYALARDVLLSWLYPARVEHDEREADALRTARPSSLRRAPRGRGWFGSSRPKGKLQKPAERVVRTTYRTGAVERIKEEQAAYVPDGRSWRERLASYGVSIK
jgi:hypothetical protein